MSTKPYKPLVNRYVVTNHQTGRQVVLQGFHHEIVHAENHGIVSTYIRVVHSETGESLIALPVPGSVICTRKGLYNYVELIWSE